MSKECSIVKDLLPLYLEGMVNEDTSSFVEEHLKNCPECNELFNTLKENNDNNTNVVENSLDDGEVIKKVKRKLKKKNLLSNILSVLLTFGIIFGFSFFQYFYYSTEYLNEKEFQLVQDEFNLNLNDVNWRYTKYEKNTILNKLQPRYDINNFSLEIFPSTNSTVTISVTKDDEFIQLALPWIKNNDQVTIEKSIKINDCDILVQVIMASTKLGIHNDMDENVYLPIYCFIFEQNGINYRITMETNSKQFYYYKNEQNIHENELNAYLTFLKGIVNFNIEAELYAFTPKTTQADEYAIENFAQHTYIYYGYIDDSLELGKGIFVSTPKDSYPLVTYPVFRNNEIIAFYDINLINNQYYGNYEEDVERNPINDAIGNTDSENPIRLFRTDNGVYYSLGNKIYIMHANVFGTEDSIPTKIAFYNTNLLKNGESINVMESLKYKSYTPK